jgi:ABC-type Na+ transport system ATPase subunit NatA
MLSPTDGFATIAGKDTRTQMDAIRQDIGICLQHDCLFPELTVKEHIQFFARIKGLYARMNAREVEEKVDTSIQDVALSEKRNTLSKNLSGGMKRKLSVAIAFCGDSKTVLLDEPTSGMVSCSKEGSIRDMDKRIILISFLLSLSRILSREGLHGMSSAIIVKIAVLFSQLITWYVKVHMLPVQHLR